MKPASLTFLLVCISFSFVKAQTLQTETESFEWRAIPSYSLNPISSSEGNFNKSRIETSPTETAVLVGYEKDNYGVILVDNNLKIKWNTPVGGTPTFIGKFRDKILVNVIVDENYNRKAVLIDPSNGKIVLSKSVDGDILFIPEKNDCKIIERKVIPDRKKNIYPVQSAQIYNVSDQLDLLNPQEMPVNHINMTSLGSYANTKGEIYCAYKMNNKIALQKFDTSGTKLLGQQELSIDIRDDDIRPQIFVGQKYPDRVYVSIAYRNSAKDKVHAIYKIDFSENKISSSSEIINKDYKKNIKESFVRDDDMDKPYFDNWDDVMSIIDVQEYNDELLVYKEASTFVGTGGKIEFYTNDGLVEVLNAAMNPIFTQVIPKQMGLYEPLCLSSSMHVQNDKLYILSADIVGPLSYKPLLAEIDLTANKLIKYTRLDKGEVKKSYSPDPKATLWFNDGFVVMNIFGTTFSHTKYSTSLQKFSY